ncbi:MULTISPECIES: GNAT family N-acetyltransferase [unclassified Paenibacillus]|uniref:GNAT family N-acetyltransferase n=1 Tax=unclassified Paenibacillus TaxID=185978 RepID=UPI001C11BCEF|nr:MULTISPECIES: GNAT family N-acetyltransferase [unclassified Paenibacillus]MBU5440571.1 GNAT family N-acetyltransferase [Paenibacillus sp. MSJ-34]CAH0120037.1 Acetyltransferase [Paenibacillus sp. CECT 9249]
MAVEMIHVTTEQQLKQCLEIRNEVFVREQRVDESLEYDDYDRLDAQSYHMLVLDEERAAATGRLILYGDNAAKMQRIAVRKTHRGTGLGRVLLLALEQLARDLGLKESILDAQCQAEQFYAKLGYAVVSEEPFYDAGILHVRMKKQL